MSTGDEPIRFERSLQCDEVRGSEALLAYAMNGEPLPIQHGFPLRVTKMRWPSWASLAYSSNCSITCCITLC